MTEKESAHPTIQQLDELTTTSTANGDLVGPVSPTSLVPPTAIGEENAAAAAIGDMPSPVPLGTSIQPPTEDHNLPEVDDLKISEKVFVLYMFSIVVLAKNLFRQLCLSHFNSKVSSFECIVFGNRAVPFVIHSP